MKITARITFSKCVNREFLIQAFFDKKEFSSKNSIHIENDKTAVVQIFFEDNPPQSLIKAISYCEINELDFSDEGEPVKTKFENEDKNTSEDDSQTFAPSDIAGQNEFEPKKENNTEEGQQSSDTEEQSRPKPEEDQLISEPSDAEDSAAGSSEQDDSEFRFFNTAIGESTESDKGTKVVKKGRHGRTKPSAEDYLDIPVFDEIVTQCSNFDEFTRGVAKWMGLQEKETEYFCMLTKELSKIDGQEPYELRNSQVKDAHKATGLPEYRKTRFSKTITTLLEEKEVFSTMLPLLSTVLKYNSHFPNIDVTSNTQNTDDTAVYEDAENAQSAEIVVDSESKEPHTDVADADEKQVSSSDVVVSDNVTETEAHEEKDENNIRNNPKVAEILSRIDNTKPLRERIEFLYHQMGFQNFSPIIFKKFCEVTMVAISMDALESIDDVMTATGYDMDCWQNQKIKTKFSQLIIDFNKTNHIKKMKVIVFLREIKDIFS